MLLKHLIIWDFDFSLFSVYDCEADLLFEL